jgi:hypothetical protein
VSAPATGSGAGSTSDQTTKTTTTRTAGSDTLFLGLLGLGVFLAFLSLFYNRIAKFTGPFGLGFELTPEESAQGAETIARVLGQRVLAARAGGERRENRLAVMALDREAFDPEEVKGAATETALLTSKATAIALKYAQTLKGLAAEEPKDLRVFADALGIPESEWTPLLRGVITPQLWERLAQRGLKEASASS